MLIIRSFFMLVFCIINRISADIHCLGNTGTYVINVKVYLDEPSTIALGHFMEKIAHNTNNDKDLVHRLMKKQGITQFEAYRLQTKKFIGFLFDSINAQLLDSNIQLKADFSKYLEGEYTEMPKKYCRKGSNITAITETFLEELPKSGDSGENHLLVINCHGNLGSLPTVSHTASRNRCGHVIGINLSDPGAMRTTIVESLYGIVMNSSIVGNLNPHLRLVDNACAFIHYCNQHYEDTGTFYMNLRSLGSPSQLRKLEYLKGDAFTGGFEFSKNRAHVSISAR